MTARRAAVGGVHGAGRVTETRSQHVRASADTPAIPPEHVAHRQAFEAFVLEHAEPRHRDVLRFLYERWHEYNERFFTGQLVVPYILLAEPKMPSALGDCAPVSGFGARSQIRIRPSIVFGGHPLVRSGAAFAEGRLRFAADVLLHEMVHQYHQEVTGVTEDSYSGHGPAFRDECNRIGALLGLPPVRTCKARGRDRDLPSCSHWPHNVRPPDYYLGAVVERSRRRLELSPATIAAALAADAELRLAVARKLAERGIAWPDVSERARTHIERGVES